jgi:hypothetical protein
LDVVDAYVRHGDRRMRRSQVGPRRKFRLSIPLATDLNREFCWGLTKDATERSGAKRAADLKLGLGLWDWDWSRKDDGGEKAGENCCETHDYECSCLELVF